MITIDYPDHSRIAIRVPELNDEQKAIVSRIVRAHGITEDEYALMAVVLAEQIHEEAVYRRVAERRGVLAL